MNETIAGPDGKARCRWCGAAPEFLDYHDTEWGFPVDEDQRLFEKLSLEGFQSGLSWRTILAKRENFRAAFHDFDFDRIARYTRRDIDRLLKDAGIVRHRGKIESTINTHPAVLESAAYGVASELSESDVMVAVVLRPGETLDALSSQRENP